MEISVINFTIAAVIFSAAGCVLTLIIFKSLKKNENENQNIEVNNKQLDDKINLQKELSGLQKALESMKSDINTKALEESKQRGSLEQKLSNIVDTFSKNNQVTENLSNALTANTKFQGDFGETSLQKLLELHGFKENIHYAYQTSYRDEDNKLKRPDFTFKLPDNNQVFIDSKVSLKHFVEYNSAKKEEEKQHFLKQNLKSIDNHIKDLCSADYVRLSKSKTDFIIMYLPIEGAYNAAISLDKNIFLNAQKKKILVCTPTTMMFCLNLIKNVFQRYQVNKNALEISRQTGNLYDRIIDLFNNILKVSKDMNQVRIDFEDTFKIIKTGRGSIVSRIESIKSLGLQTKKTLPQTFEPDNLQNDKMSESQKNTNQKY